MSDLPIVIAGVPPGVKVGVYDLSKKRGDPERPILLEESTSDDCVLEKEIGGEHANKNVRVVARLAGFVPIEFDDVITVDGLFRAVRLDIDRNYFGRNSKVPPNWNPAAELRRAESEVQRRRIESQNGQKIEN